MSQHAFSEGSTSFSPDGSRVATVGDNTVWVWDATKINREFLGREFAAATGIVK